MKEKVTQLFGDINTVLKLETYSSYEKANRIIEIIKPYANESKVLNLLYTILNEYMTSTEKIDKVQNTMRKVDFSKLAIDGGW